MVKVAGIVLVRQRPGTANEVCFIMNRYTPTSVFVLISIIVILAIGGK